MLQQQQAGPVRPVQVVEDHDQACLPRRTSREGGHGVEQSERAVSGSREGGGSSSGTHLGHLRTRALPRPRSSDPTPPAPREPGPGPGPRAARRCGSCRCRARPPPAPAGLARPGCPPVRRRAGRAQAGGPTNTLSTCASVVGASGMGRRPMSGCSSANTCSSRDRPVRPPPPYLQVRASPASSGRRSPHAGAALGPRTPMEGSSTSASERRPKLVERRSNPSLPWARRPHAWRLIVLARGPAPVARGSAG
jgi:hypothetical protein